MTTLPEWFRILLLTTFAIQQGLIEQTVYRSGFITRANLFKWFTAGYHIPLFLGWLLICTVLGLWWFFPAFCVIEDWAWYRFHPHKRLGPNSWSNFGLGGFRLFGEWIPVSYLIGILTSLTFCSLAIFSAISYNCLRFASK